MFKFSRKPELQEEERMALALAKTLSLQAAKGGESVAPNTALTPATSSSPKVEVRKAESKDKEKEGDFVGFDDEESAPPSLPEVSMKIGTKTPDGVLVTAELKREWRRCIEEGRITDIDAKELHYSDLLALLGPCRRVLLSKHQVEEIHEHSIITGKIVIIWDGFLHYLMHCIRKLRHKLWFAHRRIKELESEVCRLVKELAVLEERVKQLERLLHVLEEEVKTLTLENDRLTKTVEELGHLVRKLNDDIAELQNQKAKLEREVQYWKDKYEHEKKEAERYKHLWRKCRHCLKATRDAYDRRSRAVIDLLMQPLPDCSSLEDEGEEENEDGEERKKN